MALSPEQERKKEQALKESEHHVKHGSQYHDRYSESDYARDEKIFGPESVGQGEEISNEAFKAQERMNKHPEMGKKYFSKKKAEEDAIAEMD